jgi:hypothetical protein
MKLLNSAERFLAEMRAPTGAELIMIVAVGTPIAVLLLCLFGAMLLPGAEYSD